MSIHTPFADRLADEKNRRANLVNDMKSIAGRLTMQVAAFVVFWLNEHETASMKAYASSIAELSSEQIKKIRVAVEYAKDNQQARAHLVMSDSRLWFHENPASETICKMYQVEPYCEQFLSMVDTKIRLLFGSVADELEKFGIVNTQLWQRTSAGNRYKLPYVKPSAMTRAINDYHGSMRSLCVANDDLLGAKRALLEEDARLKWASSMG